MKKILATLLLTAPNLCAFATTMTPADVKPFTYHDLINFERVSDPVIAPNDTQVAYVLRSTDLANNKAMRSLWLVDTKGSNSKKISQDQGNSSDPAWAANGDLYYLGTASGSSQVWRWQASSQTHEQITKLPLDVGSFKLSPTGEHLAVTIDVFSDCATLECSAERLKTLEANPSAGQLYEKLFVRHWDTWKNGSRSQLFTLALKDGKVAGPAVLVSKGLDGDTPSKPFGGAEQITFTQNGQRIFFTLREAGRTEAWSTNLDLWHAPVDGSSAPENFTPNNQATDTDPVISPDGKVVAWRAMTRPTFEADRYRMMLRDLTTGLTVELASHWDRSADSLVWAKDGKSLYAHADDLGQHRVFSIDIKTQVVTPITGNGWVEGMSVGNHGVVVAQNNLGRPSDLFLVQNDKAVQLTQHNSEKLKSLSFSEYEQFSFSGWNQEKVYGYVVKPTGYIKGKKYPVAFIVHGGPQGSMANHFHYRWNPQTYAGAGYAVVFIDFHGSTGYGQAFTDSITGDWGGKPLEDLKKGWAHALKTYDFLDESRAAALGASYGGYMMNWIAGKWPNTFKAIVNHDGIFDNRSMYYTTEEMWFDEWEHQSTHFDNPAAYEKHNPVNHVKQWKTPMLVIQGGLDFRVPPGQGIATFTALQRRGIPSQFLYFPTENHWVLKPQNSIKWHQTVEAWLKRWL